MNLKNRIWLVPSILSLASLILAVATIMIDYHFADSIKEFLPGLMKTKIGLAQTVLSTIA
ncbi:hypothetical protein D3H55_02385 [Bacillus salacetis]|uniref:Uncharacterized protein n=1 Tax=Bacillus salacetis TaxID=2315464 RepID=A0A3A1R5W3_9BACI|nr:hypothetical protein [Bacillus salacetis]RIW38405.1 hypothetical protein D3H55_02385 [Bacillus salacetis]